MSRTLKPGRNGFLTRELGDRPVVLPGLRNDFGLHDKHQRIGCVGRTTRLKIERPAHRRRPLRGVLWCVAAGSPDGPRRLELVCTVGLIAPAAFHWRPALTVLAAAVLAIESLVFIGVHAKYREIASIVMSGVLGLPMAFIAYGRAVLRPIV